MNHRGTANRPWYWAAVAPPTQLPSPTTTWREHSSYANVIVSLKKEERLRTDVEQRQAKYLNNGIESDHAPIKKLVVSTGGFKIRKRAWLTI